MKVDITIPAMGESVSEAIISRIIKTSGSFIRQDEEILELETDKVNQVLYAPHTGLLTLHVRPEEVVKIGQVIGCVDTEAKAPVAPPAPLPPSAPQPSGPSPKTTYSPSLDTPVQPPPVTDNARITTADFVSSLKTPQLKPLAPSLEKSTRKKMSPLRKVIANRLVEAKNTTAMLTTFNEIDMSQVIEIRAKEKEAFQKKHGAKLGFMSFFVKASVAALKAIPEVNAYIDKDEIVSLKTYDISVAVSTDRGLMVPVIRNCDTLDFSKIEKALELLSKKAREGTISVDDLKGGSFTITNGGIFGSLLSTPILNPPQSAILGMHAIVKRAVVIDDAIVIRPMMYVALSYDHRIIDGKEAVLFLVHLKQNLEDPSRLLLDL